MLLLSSEKAFFNGFSVERVFFEILEHLINLTPIKVVLFSRVIVFLNYPLVNTKLLFISIIYIPFSFNLRIQRTLHILFANIIEYRTGHMMCVSLFMKWDNWPYERNCE